MNTIIYGNKLITVLTFQLHSNILTYLYYVISLIEFKMRFVLEYDLNNSIYSW